MATNGVPVFVAKRALDQDGAWATDGGTSGCGYILPPKWQQTPADPTTIDAWALGDALCAVMGHVVDLVDVDPRSGGDVSFDRIQRTGVMPTWYGHAATPSGGDHYFVATLNERSITGLMSGLDIKAGNSNGEGRGFAFIAPTVKRSKVNHALVPYVWETPPELDQLALVGGDNTGARLIEQIRQKSLVNRNYNGPDYDGPGYAELPPDEQRLAVAYVNSELAGWRDRLAEAVEWPEGVVDGRGRGWESLTKDAAWVVARLALAPWTPLALDDAEDAFHELLPPEIADNPQCQGKWNRTLLKNATAKPHDGPWWIDFLAPNRSSATTLNPADLPDFPPVPDDAYMAEWMVVKALNLDWCWAGRSLGWMHWDGRRWVKKDEEELRECVRNVVIDVCQKAVLKTSLSQRQLTQYIGMRSNGRIGAISQLMRGVNLVNGQMFDQQPDLLNVANGVIDLRTGALLPHDRKWNLTKIADTKFVPGQRHDDWDQCLTALEPDVAEWMRFRVGQAVTGRISSDDKMPVGQGGGSNGKSTFLAALRSALGEYVTFIPDKLLRAGVNDHPTELMTLFGARIAVIDETPEAAQLNVQRLKSVVGAEWITARQIHKDNVTWKATHSLFVMTNYVPAITETDNGTWRRLVLIRFSKKFANDDAFRARVVAAGDVFREAVLAWVVRGAFDWYQNGGKLPLPPESVQRDNDEWRMDSDLVLRFIHEHLIFDGHGCIASRDLLETLNSWLGEHRQKPWGDRLVTTRFASHTRFVENGVTKYQHPSQTPPKNLSRPPDAIDAVSPRPVIWRGVRWRTEDDV